MQKSERRAHGHKAKASRKLSTQAPTNNVDMSDTDGPTPDVLETFRQMEAASRARRTPMAPQRIKNRHR